MILSIAIYIYLSLYFILVKKVRLALCTVTEMVNHCIHKHLSSNWEITKCLICLNTLK